MTDLSQGLGLSTIQGIGIATGWLDIDLDGANEPYFVTEGHIYYVDMGETGPELKEAKFTSPDGIFSETVTATVPLDADNDGQQDLMLLGDRMRLYRVSAPGELTMIGSPSLKFPASRAVNDGAAGDLNGDGWPDVVLAMIGPEMGALQLGGIDMVLMNRGGKFELVDIKPSVRAMTHSLTLADIDFDGRPDIIESVNYSGVTGPSRILLNRTEPGAKEPTFDVAPYTFDHESFGMGAAIADIDGDGLLDIYNASMGRDYLMMGLPDGSYSDVTYERGFFHEWGQRFMRVQWSPTFDDIDGDGDLDLFVRHGHLGPFQLFGIAAELPERHLIYVQADDGTFSRADVPFDEDATIGGLDAVLGDLNGDGLPDVAMGNTLMAWFGSATLPGANAQAHLWLNETPLQAGTKAFTLRLLPTITADPPVGARVIGSCGGKTQVRHFTHGGKMGAGAPTEFHMALTDCDESPTFTVHWPSGARSEHVSTAEGRMDLVEPTWWTLSGNEGQWQLKLDAAASGRESVCFGQEDDVDATCCGKNEGSCAYAYEPGTLDIYHVRVQDGPPQRLPRLIGEFHVETVPLLPRPGESFEIVVHRSGLDGTFDGDLPWIRVEDQKIPWLSIEPETGTFRAEAIAPADGAAKTLTLLYDTKVLEKRTLVFGHNLHPDHLDPIAYPTEHGFMESTWWLILAASRDIDNTTFDGSKVTVRDASGALMPAGIGLFEGGLVSISIAWEALPEGAILDVYDGDKKIFGPIALTRFLSAEETIVYTDTAKGFIQRTAVVEGGDTNRIFFSLMDSQGFPIPPSPSIIKVEIDGGELIDAPSSLPQRPWETTFGFKSAPGAGEGEVRVFDTNDRLLGTWTFRRRESEKLAADPNLSYGQLGNDSIPAGVGATTTLKITPVNTYGEMLGMDVDVEVELPSYLEMDPLEVTAGGFYETTLYAGDYGGTANIIVSLGGVEAFTIVLDVIGPPPPEPKPEGEGDVIGGDMVGAEPLDSDATAEPGTEDVPIDPGCCSGGRKNTRSPWLAFIVLVFLVSRRRRAGVT